VVAYTCITLDTLYAVFRSTTKCRPNNLKQISSKYLKPRLNYNNFFEILDGGRLLSWIFHNLLLNNRSPWVVLFHPCNKFCAKMLIDTKIMAENRNSRWRPSAILDLSHHRIGPPTKSIHCATSAFQILR